MCEHHSTAYVCENSRALQQCVLAAHALWRSRLAGGARVALQCTTCWHAASCKMADEVFESQRSSGPPYGYSPYGGGPGDRG